MNDQSPTSIQTSWTWADQISTYRFWGLLIFYLLSLITVSTLSSFLPIFLKGETGTQYTEIGIIFVLMAAGGLLGFYLAWATTRWKTIPMLIFAGVLQLLGGLLITIPSLTSVTFLCWIGAFLCGLGSGAIALAVPSIIAGGRGGSETFVIAFGISFVLTRIGERFAPVFMGALWERFGLSVLGMTIAIGLLIGLLLLLPVKRSLFVESPPQRGYPLTPTYRKPVVVALSCLIPFYCLYWFYKAHGEIISMTSSQTILSPRASVIVSCFVPFFISPVIVTTLNDALNKHAAKLGKPAYRASWVVCLWSFLFFPVSIAFVQSTMNSVMSEINQQQAV